MFVKDFIRFGMGVICMCFLFVDMLMWFCLGIGICDFC